MLAALLYCQSHWLVESYSLSSVLELAMCSYLLSVASYLSSYNIAKFESFC
uniref:Uncharacterized protein n=1 Tax=Anguilla anguilla TaxID=7936 RepID=A0A0E9PAC4_ANGAN